MKRIIAYTLIISFFVITIAMGLTYSYYVPKITGNPTELTTKLSNRGIEVNYLNGSDIVINSTQTTVTKNITIKNNTSEPIDYAIRFNDVINNLT
ncbi:MAG: hypothetical protein GX864_04620, partial [Mollicutes bacterium]|nr:hypothetical protein [Mollicutes bacterium]